MDFSKAYNRTKRLGRFHHAEKLYSRVWLYALRIACIGILVVGFSAAGMILGAFMGIINRAPAMSMSNFDINTSTSYIYNSEGKELVQLRTEINRVYVDAAHISPHLMHAVVAVEDDRFYQHNGIDIQAILRAGVQQLKGGNEGGSTITQQLIKNMVLTSEQTLTRKFQEWYLALNLEHELTEKYGKERCKELILETYVNYVNYGNSTYGPEAAAQRYFNKSAADLTISEAALLAGVINAPSRYDPIENYDNMSRERQELVLMRMHDQGYITDEEYQEALDDDVFKRIQKNNKKYKKKQNNEVYSYYMDAAINQVINDLSEQYGYTYSEASHLLYYGGLKVYLAQDEAKQEVLDRIYADDSNFESAHWYQLTYYLTIFDEKDPNDMSLAQNLYFVGLYASEDEMQWAIDDFKSQHLKSGMEAGKDYVESQDVYEEPQSTAVLMDQKTGVVLAIVGGRGEKTQSRSLNRATDTARQPGSTFKVIASFTGAIDSGHCTPASVYDDVPFTYGDWTVHNWWGDSYKGLCTLREATANSQNIIAAKCMIDYGVENNFEYVKSYGFTTLREEPDENGNTDVVPSLCLGSGSVTNLELTAAYATIANGGVYHEPIFYTRVEDSEGNIVIDKQPETHRVIKETTAYLLTSMMEDCVSGANGGTGTYADFDTSMGIAGKTGTTTDEHDLWFVGYTPYYTLGIWTGYDYYTYKNVDDSVSRVTGFYHIMLFDTIMSELHEGLERKQFSIPDGITTKLVCTESGQLATNLCSADPRHCVYTEYFDINNVPTEYCKVHVGGTVCSETGMAPTKYCPSTRSGVFIQRTEEQLKAIDRSQTGKIADWRYEAPSNFSSSGATCNVHTEEWYKAEQKKKAEEEAAKKKKKKKSSSSETSENSGSSDAADEGGSDDDD